MTERSTQTHFCLLSKHREKAQGHLLCPQSASNKVHGHPPLHVDHRAPVHHPFRHLWAHAHLRHHLTLALGHHLHPLNEVPRPQRALQGTLQTKTRLQT